MESEEVNTKSYAVLLQSLKAQISQARIRAHLAVNKEMISLILEYWQSDIRTSKRRRLG